MYSIHVFAQTLSCFEIIKCKTNKQTKKSQPILFLLPAEKLALEKRSHLKHKTSVAHYGSKLYFYICIIISPGLCLIIYFYPKLLKVLTVN